MTSSFAGLTKSMCLVVGLALLIAPVSAQPKPPTTTPKGKAAPKSEAAPKTPTTPKSTATNDKPAEPATVEAAMRVLDLRTFPVIEGAKVSGNRTLGMLMYEVKGTPKAAMEFQRQQLLKRGFKELPGGYADENTQTAQFLNNGFHVAVSASARVGDAEKQGGSSVSLVNDGNVAVDKLPVPPGVKPFYPAAYQASYTTAEKPAEVAAACRKLLLAAGWEPYGQNDPTAGDAESSMQHFKRNAIKLTSWVSTTPAEGGKTLIRYNTELLSADLPAPPDVADPRYTDFQKTLRFDAPQDQTAAIVEFYQQRLPKLGWKATTDRPVTDDEKKSQFLIFRNAQKELLSLDLAQFTDIVRVKLLHQTAAELAAEEQRFKEQLERQKEELARKNRSVKIAVPLPPGAENVEHSEENLIEFTLPSGNGPAALTRFRDHFRKAGWQEEEGTMLEKNTGNLELTKDDVALSCSYFDTELTPVEIRITAAKNVVLDPIASKEKPPLAKGKPAKDKPGKKPGSPIPGLPELPPGVELPDDVNELLQKALKEAEQAKPGAAKKPTPKKAG